MVAVAQLVEPRVVVPVVEGSSPFSHPNGFVGSNVFSALRSFETVESSRSSSNNLVLDISEDVRQSKITTAVAVSQFFVIYS